MNIKKPTAYAEALITESMEQRLLMAHLRCPSTIRSLYAILSLPKQYRSAQMTRILFICHGNICRSPMAEFVMKDLVKKAGLEAWFHIESAATSTEEIGNPVYPPARRKLTEHGIDCSGKTARQLQNDDYEEYDLLIGMGSGQSPQYASHLWRGLRGQDAPLDGIHRAPRRCGRPVVHRRFRGHMAGCAGRVSGVAA